MLKKDNLFSKLNIMIVESADDSCFCEDFINKFNSVIFKDNENDAIDYYKNNLNTEKKIDIILSQMYFSDKKATNILENIKKIDENISFIIFTKDIENSDLLTLIKLEISDFLFEPFTFDEIMLAIEKICDIKYNQLFKEKIQKDLENIIDLVDEVSIVSKTNLHNEIIFVNKSFCEISNFTQEELIGKKHNFLSDINRVVFDELEEIIHKGVLWEGKMKYLSKDSEEFFTYLTVIPLLDFRNNIKEFIWIQFLATEYEQEQKNFKRKVAQNINVSRRINTQAREKIDELQNQLEFYNSIDYIIEEEEKRKSKFTSQYKYFEKLSNESEEKLKEVSTRAKEKIKEVVSLQQEAKERNDLIRTSYKKVSREFFEKTSIVKDLVSVLSEQKNKIDTLLSKIDIKEIKLGLK